MHLIRLRFLPIPLAQGYHDSLIFAFGARVYFPIRAKEDYRVSWARQDDDEVGVLHATPWYTA